MNAIVENMPFILLCLAMIAVVILAYIIPTILGNDPIYETLLMRLLKKNKGIDFDKTKSVLEEYVVPMALYRQHKQYHTSFLSFLVN